MTRFSLGRGVLTIPATMSKGEKPTTEQKSCEKNPTTYTE
jgi:hypothetical protein